MRSSFFDSQRSAAGIVSESGVQLSSQLREVGQKPSGAGRLAGE